MAFKRENFTSVNAQLYGKELINEWKYVTSDEVPTLAGADYFGEVQKSLHPNDIIYVYLVSGDEGNGSYYQRKETFCVRMSDDGGGHVAVLPTSDLDGQGVLKNTNGGDAGVIVMSADYAVTAAYAIVSGGVDSDGDTNTITVKNGTTTLFTATITNVTADGAVIGMTKNGSASAESFQASSFAIANDGAAAIAHGTVTIVLVSTKVPAA